MPDEGSIALAVADVKRMTGVVPEDLGLLDSLTVKEQLELSGRVYGLNREQIRSRIESFVQTLGLGEAMNTFLERCSHGTRKKTGLAMALLHNPRVLLLDEPFEGTDPISSKAIQQLFTAISKRGITIFFVAHSLHIVSQLASQVIIMHRGRLVQNSPVSALPRPLEQMYFDSVEPPEVESLSWLGCSRF